MRMQSTVRGPASWPPQPAEADTSYQALAASSGVPASAPTAPLATPDCGMKPFAMGSSGYMIFR